MSFLERVAETAFRVAGAKVTASRSYAAAQNNRLVGNWQVQNSNANQEIKQGLRILRARARQLARDNDYFIGFLRDLESNVIGANGIKPQVDAKNARNEKLKDINQKVEDAFKMWSRKAFCTVTGQDNLRDVQALALRTLATDGEFLIRLIFDSSSIYGLKLQFLDVDWLDEDFNEPQLQNGNRIIMSVELDSFDKPVAYWLTQPRWEGQAFMNTPVVPRFSDRLRVPAEQIIHRFVKERAGQARGVTWAHSAMLRMNMLGGYEESELVRSRVGASGMAFISKNTDEANYAGGTTPANLEAEVAPGSILELPAGYTMQEFSPSQPGSNYAVYVKQILRGISKGLGISYNTFASDLESTSYSSMRDGNIRERDVWKMLQAWVMEHLLQDIFAKFMMFNMTLVPATRLPDVMYPIWRARGFDWVDPSKDTRADIEALDRGLKTHTEILAERGKDFEEEMQLQAYERKFIEGLDLSFNSPNYPMLTEAEEETANAASVAGANPADNKSKEKKETK